MLKKSWKNIVLFEVLFKMNDFLFAGADYESATPFIDYVELVQVGADTLVKIDPDGDTGDRENQNLVTLRRVSTNELTADNFVFD